MRDEKRCEFIVVTIPEDMAIKETERMVKSLTQYRMKVKQLIINNVVETTDCNFCKERRKTQEKYIKEIRSKFTDLKTTIIPLQPHEVKGIDALKKLGELLFLVDE